MFSVLRHSLRQHQAYNPLLRLQHQTQLLLGVRCLSTPNTTPTTKSAPTTSKSKPPPQATNAKKSTPPNTAPPTHQVPDNIVDALKQSRGGMGVMKEFAQSYTNAVKLGVKTTLDEIVLAAKLVVRSLIRGHMYDRRDLELLRRTAKDIFRLLPFASFIMTTGFTMTYLVWARIFPSILPSHFRKSAAMIDVTKRNEMQKLGGKLEAAKEIQTLTREYILHREDAPLDQKDRLLSLLDDLQDPHATISTKDVLSITSVFKASLDLDNLDRNLLIRMARIFGIEERVPSAILRFQLRRILRNIREDDRYISVEGVASLSAQELLSACQKRGLVGPTQSDDVLRRRLTNWLSLSLSADVPGVILVLYSAFKMQHATLEEELLGPIEVKLRCLEEERDEISRQMQALQGRRSQLEQDINELDRKLQENKQRKQALAAPGSPSARLVWAEQLFSESEIQHIRRVFGRAVKQSGNPGRVLSADQAAAAVGMIKLRGNYILKADVLEYLRARTDNKESPLVVAVDEDDFVVMFAHLSGRRWQPTWEERRRLALEHLEAIAAKVEIEAKGDLFLR